MSPQERNKAWLVIYRSDFMVYKPNIQDWANGSPASCLMVSQLQQLRRWMCQILLPTALHFCHILAGLMMDLDSFSRGTYTVAIGSLITTSALIPQLLVPFFCQQHRQWELMDIKKACLQDLQSLEPLPSPLKQVKQNIFKNILEGLLTRH